MLNASLKFANISSLNRTQKQLAAVNSWENTQKAKIEAKIKKIEVSETRDLPCRSLILIYQRHTMIFTAINVIQYATTFFL